MNIIEQIKLRYEGYTKDQIDQIEQGYTKDQINQIEQGKSSGINHEIYSNKENSHEWMRVVRESQEKQITELEKYYINGEKLSNKSAQGIEILSSLFEQARIDGVETGVIDYFSNKWSNRESAQIIYDKHKSFKSMENVFKYYEDNIFNELHSLNNLVQNNSAKYKSTFVLDSSISAENWLNMKDVIELTENAMNRLASTAEEVNICLPYKQKISDTVFADYDDLSHLVMKTNLTKEKYFENEILRDLISANNFLSEYVEIDYKTISSIEKASIHLDFDTATTVISNAKAEFFETVESPAIRFPNGDDDDFHFLEMPFVVRNNTLEKTKSIHL